MDKSRNRENKGKGLRLAIVRELVCLHGGEVKGDSIIGKGSTFSLSIPVNPRNKRQEAGGKKDDR